MKPRCFNRPPFKDTIIVQDGWLDHKHIQHPFLPPVASRVPLMREIPDPMSKECQQHGPLGEATLHGWDCEGCRWKPAIDGKNPA